MAYLYRTNSGASGTTATVSAWVKSIDTSFDAGVFQFKSNADMVPLYINPIIKLRTYISSSTSNGALTASRKMRDFSSWFHIVATIDTTNATSTDRLRIYVNGERITDFSSTTYPSQNYSYTPIVSGNFELGKYSSTQGPTYLAHVHYCDGYAYNADSFGSTDATTGEWKINTAPNVQYGTNGVFLKFANSGAMGTDSSGNNNTMSISGSCLQTQDNPSNNFCTFNAVNPYSGTLSNGNLKMSQTNFHYNVQGTLGMESGKYYWEYKLGSTHGEFGICEQGKAGQTDPQGSIGFYMIYSNGSGGVVVYNNATSSSSTTNSGWTNFASGQIIGIAYDADNGKLYFHNNGTYYNSGDPAAGTGAVITGISPQYGGIMVPFCGHGSSSITANTEANFGNGYFGTTAISSEGTNASGIGKFEYDVPTGFTALSTKGLNE